jgi:hypothetical protein
MRIDALHRRVSDDVKVMHEPMLTVLPVQLPARYLTGSMSLRSLIERLNAVSHQFNVHNEIQHDTDVAPGEIAMTGLWLGADELPENDSSADIRVIWHVHQTTKKVVMTQAEWNRRRYYWWQMVMHELIHRHQDTYRTNEHRTKVFRPWSTQRDVKEDQAYFGDYDEIETHSHDAAVEFFVWWHELSLRDAQHEAASYSGRIITPTYNRYLNAFIDSPKHPALKTYLRKLKAWHDRIKKHPDIYHLLELPKLI